MDEEFCNHKMTGNRLCGRLLFHARPHRSYAGVAHKQAAEKEKRRKARAARADASLRHRGREVRLPPERLPGTALASLAKYRKSGMVRPGDKLYEQIARRLLQQEGVSC